MCLNKIHIVMSANFLMSFCNVCFAEKFDITAEVGMIRYAESSQTIDEKWRKHVWFTLVNPDQSPDCPKYQGDYAISVPDGNETAISMILAAQVADKKVRVVIDDDVRFPAGINQECKLQFIDLLP